MARMITQQVDKEALAGGTGGAPAIVPDADLIDSLAPFFDRMPMGIAVFDRNLRLVRCNATWADFIARYTATPRESVVPGAGFFALAPGTEESMRPRFRRVLSGETVREDEIHLVSTGGAESWWDAVLAPWVAGGAVVGIIDVVTDATDRVLAYRLLEQRVAERTRELQLLLGIAHDVATTLELAPLVGLILDRVKGVVDYTGAALFLLDDDGEGLNLLRYQGPIPQHTLAWRWYLSSHDHARAVIEGRKPVIIEDVFADTPLANAFRRNAAADIGEVRADFGTWMGVPMAIGDRVTGMLAVEIGEVGYYTAHHAELLQAVADQAAVAVENARLYEQARGLAALEERQKLARELHDSVSQALYGIGLGARTARTLLDRDPVKVAEPLDYVISLAEAGLTEMRALIFELRPDALESEGIVGLLEKQAAALRVRHGLSVETDLGPEPPISLATKEALYRIAQEALNNTVKHARATRVTLRLNHHPNDGTTLEIADDGIGFDPTGAFPGHLGLRSMRERAARQGAVLEVTSSPGQGTRTRVVVPVAR
jgi:signal transduction histidine kinase